MTQSTTICTEYLQRRTKKTLLIGSHRQEHWIIFWTISLMPKKVEIIWRNLNVSLLAENHQIRLCLFVCKTNLFDAHETYLTETLTQSHTNSRTTNLWKQFPQKHRDPSNASSPIPTITFETPCMWQTTAAVTNSRIAQFNYSGPAYTTGWSK